MGRHRTRGCVLQGPHCYECVRHTETLYHYRLSLTYLLLEQTEEVLFCLPGHNVPYRLVSPWVRSPPPIPVPWCGNVPLWVVCRRRVYLVLGVRHNSHFRPLILSLCDGPISLPSLSRIQVPPRVRWIFLLGLERPFFPLYNSMFLRSECLGLLL